MKCVLDTTINLKQLVASAEHKLLLMVNGRSILEQQFDAMHRADVSSVYVLVSEDEDNSRTDISRIALKFGYNPTFIPVPEKLIEQRLGLKAAETMLKQDFLYLPVNRLITPNLLRQLVSADHTSYQLTGMAYVGRQHPQLTKTSIFKTNLSTAEQDEQPPVGHDLGVYRCSPMLFKLLEKVAEGKAFSWNKMQVVLARAGRNQILEYRREDWGVIESNADIEDVEKLAAQAIVQDIGINQVDKQWLGPAYAQVLPFLSEKVSWHNHLVPGVIGAFIVAHLAVPMGAFFSHLFSAMLMVLAILLFPLASFLNRKPLPNWVSGLSLPIIRISLLLNLGLTSLFSDAGSAWWWVAFLSILIEAFFIFRPMDLPSDDWAAWFDSYALHSVWIFFALILTTVWVTLTLQVVLTLTVAGLKAFQFYQQRQLQHH